MFRHPHLAARPAPSRFRHARNDETKLFFSPVIDVAAIFRWRSVHVRNAQKAGCRPRLSQQET
jgi:hypothetical protein